MTCLTSFFELILLWKYETTVALHFILSRRNEISKLYNFKALTYFSFWFFFLVVGKVILYKTAKTSLPGIKEKYL